MMISWREFSIWVKLTENCKKCNRKLYFDAVVEKLNRWDNYCHWLGSINWLVREQFDCYGSNQFL